MRVLLVTGTLAAPIVYDVIKNIRDIQVEVKVLDYPVTALMSTKYIAEKLKKDVSSDKKIDYILVPGLVYGDAKIIEKETGIKAFKGTEEAWDIPKVIEALKSGIELSTIEPADKIIGKVSNVEEKLKEIEEDAKIAFEIGDIKIPITPPPFRIFLEFDHNWDFSYLEKVRRLVDIIVLGFPVGHNDIEELRKKIRILVDSGYVVGIDADSPKALIEGVKSGASVVFNLNELNIDKLEEIKDSAFVVAPFSTENKGEITVKLISEARRRGFKKLIADPILSPPLKGMVKSMFDYAYVREKLSDVPILMGILNVTELLDADSVGINALLTTIAGEIGISNLLIMDKGKTRWSSWEVKQASKMVSIALKENRVPKDLGIDLLILKDKNKIKKENKKADIQIKDKIDPIMDQGYAKVFIADDGIGIEWYGKERVTIKGKDALSLGRALLRRINEVSKEHALYIGYELAKAEIAYQLDKNYIQDKPLFKKIVNDDNSDSVKNREDS
ncbi:dihydropteroate synthase-like protein [Sulfolobus sp. E1]|nr:dihydropteroate synthase-like protein [Sulfolobus sp. E1]